MAGTRWQGHDGGDKPHMWRCAKAGHCWPSRATRARAAFAGKAVVLLWRQGTRYTHRGCDTLRNGTRRGSMVLLRLSVTQTSSSRGTRGGISAAVWERSELISHFVKEAFLPHHTPPSRQRANWYECESVAARAVSCSPAQEDDRTHVQSARLVSLITRHTFHCGISDHGSVYG